MNKYMEIAKDLADNNLNANVGGPFGAVIVKDGKVIGKGSNHVLNHNDPTAHAEIMAIRDACQSINSYSLEGCEIYTSCYPCPMCLSAIIWANIKKVYYGNTKEDANKIGFRDEFIYDYFKSLEGDLIEFKNIDREDTIDTFNKYLEKEDKEIY